jgi:hypothetical protein
VVESSLDFMNWTEIDRKKDNYDFSEGWAAISFAVSNSPECRFIRLTQTAKNHQWWHDGLRISCFEVFGTLID